MAHDLLLGKTTRDWSCGGAAAPAPERPWERLPPAPAVAEAARSEMWKAASTAIRLRKLGQLPDASWREFGNLHRRWIALSDARRGRWSEADSLPLWNLRQSCAEFGKRFAALDELSRPGSKDLALATPALTQSNPGPWYAVLGAALALAGVGLFARRSQPS